MTKEQEIMDFLSENVFDPILNSGTASKELKAGVNLTIMRLKKLRAEKMMQYYWTAIIGTLKSTEFARQMKAEGFTRFEEVIDEFRDRFNDTWLTKGGCS